MTNPMSFEIDRSQRKLGPIWLSPGIAPANAMALFFSSMMVIVFVTAAGVLSPYLLHAHLDMASDDQGDFMGNLTVVIEIIAIALVFPIGVLSDKIGRRPLFVTAFAVICLGCLLLPLADTPLIFALFRVLMGIGFATGTVMLGTVIADYPQNASRGKLISINGVITGFGVVLIAAFGFGRMPEVFTSRGIDPVDAGTYTFWAMAAAALVACFVTWRGLKEGAPALKEKREPLPVLWRKGYAATRGNPRLCIAGLAYFVSRGDLIVMTTFFSLWIVAVGTDSGLETAAAQSRAGQLFGISQLAMILFTPVMGVLVDRFDRVTVLALALGVAAAGYLALGLVGSPFTSEYIYLVAVLAGAGEACILVSGPALVGQEAPGPVRGSVFGLMGLCGAIGVLVHSKVCGVLFDSMSYQTPFFYIAAVNGVIGVAAVFVRLRCGPSRPAPHVDTAPAMEMGNP